MHLVLLSIAVCVLITVSVSMGNEGSQYQNLYRSHGFYKSDNQNSEDGVVYGFRQCGGLGKLVHWRIEGCETTDSPCRFPVGITKRGSIEFIPSADIPVLGVRVVFSIEGGEPQKVYQEHLPNTSVMRGVQTTITEKGEVVEELRGKNVTVQHILYRADTDVDEVCTEADFILY